VTAIADPSAHFSPRVAIVAPHADDETLGCGALIARLAATHEIHIVFATDSSRSPEHPARPGADRARLTHTRRAEAIAAMRLLGVPPDRLRFLEFPDGALSDHVAAFARSLAGMLAPLGELDVLVPFRYDWHPDHMAAHRAAAEAVIAGQVRARLVEYFVYTQRRLLPRGDVRAYVRPAEAITVPLDGVDSLKRRALDCFTSQTTRYFEWQDRPVLTEDVLRRSCTGAEWFVPYAPLPANVLRAAAWVRLATAIEPPLKRIKDDAVGWLRR
jgi:LmbE family N-acetylglucosaminyl deacetylase